MLSGCKNIHSRQGFETTSEALSTFWQPDYMGFYFGVHLTYSLVWSIMISNSRNLASWPLTNLNAWCIAISGEGASVALPAESPPLGEEDEAALVEVAAEGRSDDAEALRAVIHALRAVERRVEFHAELAKASRSAAAAAAAAPYSRDNFAYGSTPFATIRALFGSCEALAWAVQRARGGLDGGGDDGEGIGELFLVQSCLWMTHVLKDYDIVSQGFCNAFSKHGLLLLTLRVTPFVTSWRRGPQAMAPRS